MTTSRLNRYIEIAEGCGLRVDSVTQNKHWKIVLVAEDGRKKTFVVAVSSSDRRAELNYRSDVRKFAQGR